MSSGYEDETEISPPKKMKKTLIKRPSNEEVKENIENEEAPKKLSVKTMVHEALADLKSRKGTSLYAIKKYMHENYYVDVGKVNYIIKKVIRSEIETGLIVQVNGSGATGSFNLAPTADKQKSKPKTKKVEKTITEKNEDGKTKKTDKKVKIKRTKSDMKKEKIVTDNEKVKKKAGDKRKVELTEDEKKAEVVRIKTTKQSKMKKVQSPIKKKNGMSKRKSIGSIIKPPKMKPKA